MLTFDDRCVDLRRSVIDVSTFNIDGRCEIRLLYLLKVLILSCMRITPRVCTSVLSFIPLLAKCINFWIIGKENRG